jgi:1-phosphofructokinase family hexose kinase
MILAINLNAALDKLYFIDEFFPNTHIRVSKTKNSIGGKGLDTALVLKTIGAPTIALTFIAGSNGKILEDLLKQNKIPSELIWLPGETREANIIVETEKNRHTHLTTFGYEVTRDDCDLLLQKVQSYCDRIDWAVMAGSIPVGAPVGIYAEIIQLLHSQNVKTLIDHSGQPLLETLRMSPDIVKMNRDELNITFNLEFTDERDWIQKCSDLVHQKNIKALVVTCGKNGVYAFTPDGIFQTFCSLELKEVNAAGAGDAVSASLSYHLSLGESWPQALRWATATGAAVVLTEDTAVCRMSDVEAIFPHINLKTIPG